MDAYETLRQRARAKREAAIRAAQKECRLALRRINELERRVGNGADPPGPGNVAKGKIVWTVVRSLIPTDREFTIDDMRQWLAENYPTRKFPVSTVRASFRRLMDQGSIRPVSRGHYSKMTYVACAGGSPDDVPFAALNLPDAAARVLRELGPMRDMELVLAIQQRGNRSDSRPKRLLKSLVKSLNHNTERFALDDAGSQRGHVKKAGRRLLWQPMPQ